MSKQLADKTFTNIIIGAGTAGCLLANRLSADPNRKVLLVEAGFDGKRYIWHNVPVGYLFCIDNPKTDWRLKLEPCEGLNGRALLLPRGKGLGGCSSINGMIYMRGQARDYDRWAQVTGESEWSWSKALERFKRHENYYGGKNDFHGSGNEWSVSKQRLSWEVLDAYTEAAVQYGIPRTDDFNRGDNTGVAYFDVNQKNGWRCSAADAFLRPVQHTRPNLTVLTMTEAGKLKLNPSTKEVEGIELFVNGASTPDYYQIDPHDPKAELILSAGALKSPQLLQASGIGPADVLKAAGIETLVDLPGVGGNLQDHLQIRTEWYVKDCPTLNRLTRNPVQLAKMGLEYLFNQSGPLSMAPSQLGIFTKSDDTQVHSNVEFHVQPLTLDKFGSPLHSFPAITSSVANLNPTSRGYLRVRSADPRQAPEIQMNYLQSQEDKKVAADCIQLARGVTQQPAMAKYLVGERKPGKEVAGEEQLAKAAGDLGTTIFHPAGTCAMGKDDDKQAVVTPDLKLRGVGKLRVVDCSVMPYITSGNTNSPTLLIAETAADFIMGKK
ncbi:GMC oxidoreductase, putative [Angomonas deanei]|uniref:GMC oxidoreductase, putative n=1 Tax=Angomonas deanei TaxID=59799 RepID=A0A7G2CTB8_9TRYP|nr:GMC oxidoreductase, putative [Angomonas deanei]